MKIEIPEMTDPLGKWWDQPNREDININDGIAYVSSKDFRTLKEYSTSTPTGIYTGKMWKSKVGKDWKLCWYEITAEGQKTGYADIRRIPLKLKTKLFGYINCDDPCKEGIAITISESGELVATHYCSNESFAIHDLGMSGGSTWKHDIYNEKFPNGWECEFVKIFFKKTHTEFQKALELSRP